ncbi:dephospho-CoA kinase [Roseomonas sp. NAR14]|uniref:Dephospho-CoA kinase n=1 Tax=Roseomonas acroporae TaxID=2937791 RepID=A0A9X2BZ23_9PROT|nr:dephospho-CoA kinase [Roseomonas acroporae]MCK8787604.1 dephospho-CoA kinase [Roseomonas acroporae]
MRIIGLTGGIGMGKSTAAGIFRRLGVPVFDADLAVHRLQGPGGRAVAPIGEAFPGTLRETPRGRMVDREALRRAVLGDPARRDSGAPAATSDRTTPNRTTTDRAVPDRAMPDRAMPDRAALNRLERIVHPLVRDEERRFLARARRRGLPLVVLDVPLLFETRGEGRCDAVVVVSAPAAVQRVRVLLRPGMTPERLDAILARQMPDAEKRRRADHVVWTGLSRHATQRAIRALVRRLRTGDGGPRRRGARRRSRAAPGAVTPRSAAPRSAAS